MPNSWSIRFCYLAKFYFLFIDLVQQGLKNFRCSDALILEVTLLDKLLNGYFKSQCSLLITDETLLALASTNDTDGIFFCCVVGNVVDDSQNKYCIAHVFESGIFTYFLIQHARQTESTNRWSTASLFCILWKRCDRTIWIFMSEICTVHMKGLKIKHWNQSSIIESCFLSNLSDTMLFKYHF